MLGQACDWTAESTREEESWSKTQRTFYSPPSPPPQCMLTQAYKRVQLLAWRGPVCVTGDGNRWTQGALYPKSTCKACRDGLANSWTWSLTSKVRSPIWEITSRLGFQAVFRGFSKQWLERRRPPGSLAFFFSTTEEIPPLGNLQDNDGPSSSLCCPSSVPGNSSAPNPACPGPGHGALHLPALSSLGGRWHLCTWSVVHACLISLLILAQLP